MAVRYLWLVCCLLSLFAAPASAAMAKPPTTDVPQSQQSIKLMTYNIHAWRDSNHECNFDRVAQVVNQVQPDILCLNEVLHPFARPSPSSPPQQQVVNDYYRSVQRNEGKNNPVDSSFIPEKDAQTFLYRLAEATNLKNVEFTGATDNSYFGRGVCFGNAILTHYPIVDCLHVPLSVKDGDIDLGNQKRDFVDPRAFSAALLDVDGDERQRPRCIGVAFTHLDHKSEELREQQIRRGIRESQEFLQGIPHILCGDFNSFQKYDNEESGWQQILDLYHNRGWPTPSERSLVIDALIGEYGYQDSFYESLKHGLSDTSSPGLPNPTSWTTNPLMRIDHVLIKNHPGEGQATPTTIVPTRHYRVDTDASDHFPVVVEVIV